MGVNNLMSHLQMYPMTAASTAHALPWMLRQHAVLQHYLVRDIAAHAALDMLQLDPALSPQPPAKVCFHAMQPFTFDGMLPSLVWCVLFGVYIADSAVML